MINFLTPTTYYNPDCNYIISSIRTTILVIQISVLIFFIGCIVYNICKKKREKNLIIKYIIGCLFIFFAPLLITIVINLIFHLPHGETKPAIILDIIIIVTLILPIIYFSKKKLLLIALLLLTITCYYFYWSDVSNDCPYYNPYELNNNLN